MKAIILPARIVIKGIKVVKTSAGLLVYRYADGALQVLLVHPGGPYWEKKDLGSWSIPKGEYTDAEDPLSAAKREFREETGQPIEGDFIPLSSVRQPGGKVISAWAVEAEFDPKDFRSNTFLLEWPPHSGFMEEFPEVDRAQWFTIREALVRILKGQAPFIRELAALKNESTSG